MAKRVSLCLCLAAAVLAIEGCYDARPESAHATGASVPTRVELAPAQDPVLASPHEPVWREYWFPIENADRDRGPVAPRILDMVAARPGMTIADLGAGGGYYAFRMASLVGDDGHVWAVDVDQRMTLKLAWEVRARGVTNMTPLHVQRGNFGLTPRSVDLVTLIDTGALDSCHAARNERYVAQVAEALTPGGRFLFHDVMHDVDNPDHAYGRRCTVISADAMRALTASRFELLREEAINTGDVWRGYVQLYRLRSE